MRRYLFLLTSFILFSINTISQDQIQFHNGLGVHEDLNPFERLEWVNSFNNQYRQLDTRDNKDFQLDSVRVSWDDNGQFSSLRYSHTEIFTYSDTMETKGFYNRQGETTGSYTKILAPMQLFLLRIFGEELRHKFTTTMLAS